MGKLKGTLVQIKERQARLDRMTADPRYTTAQLAERFDVTIGYVNQRRKIERARWESEGRIFPTCSCGRELGHVFVCTIFPPADRTTITRRLIAGDLLIDIAKDMGYKPRTLGHFSRHNLTDEQRAARLRLTHAAIGRLNAERWQRFRDRIERQAKRSKIGEYLTRWDLTNSEVAEACGYTPQGVGSLRKAIVERMRAEGLETPRYLIREAVRKGKGSLGPRKPVDRRGILLLMEKGATREEIATKLSCPLNHVDRVSSTMPEALRSKWQGMARHRAAPAQLSMFGSRHLDDVVHVRISSFVSRRMDADLADDVVQQLYLDVLEGRISIEQVKAEAAKVKAQQRRFAQGEFSNVSLDEQVFEGGSSRLDMLRDDGCEDEDEILARMDREREMAR